MSSKMRTWPHNRRDSASDGCWTHLGQHRGRGDGGPARTSKSFRSDKGSSKTLFSLLGPHAECVKYVNKMMWVYAVKYVWAQRKHVRDDRGNWDKDGGLHMSGRLQSTTGVLGRHCLLKQGSRPRCSIARGLTVINESLNVGKHFISASSVFIRQGQPLAGRERAVTFITATQKGETEGLPIGLIKTPEQHSDRSYSLLLSRHASVRN